MKNIKKLFILGFHFANIMLIIFYLYPGSLFGHFLYGDTSIQPQLTRDFIVSSNHLYAFIIFSFLGIVAYQKTQNVNFVIIYLFLISIILESFHSIIPEREFEWADLFGNVLGVFFVIIIYKIKNRYV
ncbi:VanZ family protein [Candidatus Pelagibacter sp.]|nr:VanZ family protein [Candidatus Pelagibacter sp.]